MPENQPQRLNQILDIHAPQGANDARWFLVEHQLEQCVISARAVVGSLTTISQRPENEEDRKTAEACLIYMESMLAVIIEDRGRFYRYVSGTSVPERISRKELREYGQAT